MIYDWCMRTTLTIDDDVLTAAKVMAKEGDKSVGEVISELARQSLHRPVPRRARNGVPLLPVSQKKAAVTLEIVNALRDEAP